MKTPSEPLYQTVATLITETILNGTYVKGEKLPTEEKLCNQFNVSRVTLRQALEILVQKEYVEKKRGSGTYVIYSKKSDIIKRSAKISSFSDEMATIGKVPLTKVIAFELQKPTKKIAKELHLSMDSSIFYYERIMYGNDVPRSFETGWISAEKYPDLTVEHLANSKFNYIEKIKKQGIDYSHQTLTAILSDEKLARILEVNQGVPLISVRLITYLANGDVLDVNTITFDSNKYQAHYIKYR